MLYSTESCYNEIDMAALLFLIIGFLKLLEKSWDYICMLHLLPFVSEFV